MKRESEELYNTIYNGYVYSYIPVLFNLYQRIWVENTGGNEAAASHINHMPPNTIEAQVQGGPNMDVLYSGTMLKLTEPYILEKPKTDRYLGIVLLDAYGTFVEMLGSCAVGGNEETKYALVKKGYKGSLPDGSIKIEIPTELVAILLRVRIYDEPGELEKSDELRKNVVVRSLSEYEKGIVNEPICTIGGQKKISYQTMYSYSVEEVINTYNSIADKNPPIPEDKALAESFKKVNIGAGLKFLVDDYEDPELREAIKKIPEKYVNILNSPQDTYVHRGNWLFYPPNTVMPNGDYKFRAWIQHYGPGAQPNEIACIPICFSDANGNKLSGENSYKMHFDKNHIPKHHPQGFWSISVYHTSNWWLIPNKWNKYRLNGDRDIKYNEDGSFDVIFSKKEPYNADAENWLPIGDDDFIVMLRVYVGQGNVLDNTWQPPEIEKI